MEKHYTITSADIGKGLIRSWGRTWHVSGFLGRVLLQDVGKRVYRVKNEYGDSYILQVENNEQRDVRIAKGA
jgi:hypothetical protein